MAIIRAIKGDNFSVICNELFRRDDVSARAKGIFAYIMTLPNDWKIYKKELEKHFTEGRQALLKAFQELEKKGYIEKRRKRADKGVFFERYEYLVYERLLLKTGEPETGQPENRPPDNPQLLNTNHNKILKELNTNKESAPEIPDAGYKEIIELYFTLYESINKIKPSWGKAEGMQLKRLLKQFGKDKLSSGLQAWFLDEWRIKHGLEFLSFVKNVQPMIVKANGGYSTKPDTLKKLGVEMS